MVQVRGGGGGSERHSISLCKRKTSRSELPKYRMGWGLQKRLLHWLTFGLEQASTVYGSQAKSGPPPVSVGKV